MQVRNEAGAFCFICGLAEEKREQDRCTTSCIGWFEADADFALHCSAAGGSRQSDWIRGYPFQGRLGANMVWLEARWAPEANGQPVPVSTSR